MTVNAGEYYKLKEPKWTTTYGQGSYPKFMKIKYPDKEYRIEYNTVFKASTTVDLEHKVGDLEQEPYPLLHVDFIEKYINQFEKIIGEN